MPETTTIINSRLHNDPNGWVVEFATTLNPEDPFDFVIVCAEGTLPEN